MKNFFENYRKLQKYEAEYIYQAMDSIEEEELLTDFEDGSEMNMLIEKVSKGIKTLEDLVNWVKNQKDIYDILEFLFWSCKIGDHLSDEEYNKLNELERDLKSWIERLENE